MKKKTTSLIVAALVAVCAAVGVAFWLLSSGAPSYDRICRMNDDLKQARQLGLSTQEKCAERLGAAILKTTDETVLANLLANVSFEERFANAILGKIQSPEMLETVARTFKAELIADSADNPFSESLYDAVLDRLPDDSAVERIALARLAEMGGASDARTGARAKKSSGKSGLAACLCRRILAMDDAGRAEALLEKMGKSDVLRELPFETRFGIALRSKNEKVRHAAGVDREYLELGDLVAKWDPDCLSRSVREIIARGRKIQNAQEYVEVVKRFDPDFNSSDIDKWVEYAKSVTPVLEAIERLSANSKEDSSDSFRRSRLVEKQDKARKKVEECNEIKNDLSNSVGVEYAISATAACQVLGVYMDQSDPVGTGERLAYALKARLQRAENELKEAEGELAALDRTAASQRESTNEQMSKLQSKLEQIRQRYETPETRKAREEREAAKRKAREEREVAITLANALLAETRASPSVSAVDEIARTPKNGRTISRDPYRGAIAVDADTGRILFADHADEPCIPASMVMMMDLLLVQEMIERGEARTNDLVGVSERAFKTGGSQVYLDPKEHFPLEDMLYALMIQSANDAAVAIAEHVAGSCEAMVERMNARARELGMKDTTFRSVHGLPPDAGGLHDISTPRDMAILALALCRHPDVFRYTGADYRVFRPAPRLFEMRTHNPVLQPDSRIAGADGLKTGYTKAAGYSLAVSVLRNGRRVIVVTMGTGVTDTKGELDFKASKNIRNRTISSLVERSFAALEE